MDKRKMVEKDKTIRWRLLRKRLRSWKKISEKERGNQVSKFQGWKKANENIYWLRPLKTTNQKLKTSN